MAEPDVIPGREAEAGFTLIEVLVSLAILALVMGTCFRLFGSGLRGLDRSEQVMGLALAAQGVLDEASLSFDPSDTDDKSGKIATGGTWKLQIERYEPEDRKPAPFGERQEGVKLGLWRLDVTARDNSGAVFELSTLRAGREP